MWTKQLIVCIRTSTFFHNIRYLDTDCTFADMPQIPQLNPNILESNKSFTPREKSTSINMARANVFSVNSKTYSDKSQVSSSVI